MTCIHVRRGDFLKYHHEASNEKFVTKIVEYFHNESIRSTGSAGKFVFIGQEAKWIRSIFKLNDDEVINYINKIYYFCSENTN